MNDEQITERLDQIEDEIDRIESIVNVMLFVRGERP